MNSTGLPSGAVTLQGQPPLWWSSFSSVSYTHLDAALLALTTRLDVLGNHVLALNDDLVLRGADLQDLTLSLIHILDGLNGMTASLLRSL